MRYKIYNEDVIEWAKRYDKVKFHALLCDPPYHLQSIVKRFGKKGSAPAQYGKDGAFSRASSGFMGQTWDGGDIAFNPETWHLLGEHLYPGAFMMAFSASRNWHRLAVAIEDAGFVIHPTIFLWAYGSGFPKATRIDKKVNDERWSSYRYGLQALKPAVEPIIVAQKPYEGKPLDNITQTGAGALNIDATRIPLLSEDDEYVINTFDDGAKPFGDGAGHKYTSRPMKWTQPRGGIWSTDKDANGELIPSEQGRWPANFILDEEASQRLDEQTGKLKSGTAINENRGDRIPSTVNYANHYKENFGYKDSGGASRFFHTVSEQIDESDPVYYCAKASPKEKNAGLEDQEMSRSDYRSNDPEEDTIRQRLHRSVPRKNPHPTVKPLDLCRYLATLLLPPDHYEDRTILVPFSGVGSEMIGCGLAGWDRCVGIENDTENGYIDIAEKRLEHWLKD